MAIGYLIDEKQIAYRGVPSILRIERSIFPFSLDFRKEKLAQQLAGDDKNRDEITRGDFQSFKARMTEGLELTDYDLDRIHRRVLSLLLRPEEGSVLQDE